MLEGGLVLCIDPSIGSKRSKPGFALIDKATVIHSGTIEIDSSRPPHRRLHQLQSELYAIAPAIDLLIVENIPPFMQGSGGGFRTQSVVALHWAVGTILAAYDTELVQVPIQSWRSWVTKNIGVIDTDYIKSDEKDCLAMAATVFERAGVTLSNLDDVIRLLKGEEIGTVEEV